MTDHKTFGQTIRQLREERGITLRKMAVMLDVSATYLSKIERDEPGSRPSEGVIKNIARLLDQNEDELLATAGKVSTDLQQIIMQHPKALASFLRTVKDQPESIEKTAKELLDKDL